MSKILGSCLLFLLGALGVVSCDTSRSVAPVDVRDYRVSLRIIPAPYDSSFAKSPADGGPSGAISDLSYEGRKEMKSIEKSPYGCLLSWPAPPGSEYAYSYYRYYYFYPEVMLAESKGKRWRLYWEAHIPQVATDDILSIGRCMIPASDLAKNATKWVLKEWAKDRNEKNVEFTTNSHLY